VEKTDDGVLVVRRVHVRYRLRAPSGQSDVVARVLGLHVRKCPVARTLAGCVEVTTELDLVEEPPNP
jgi:uncharacterized OsmC-like protein